MDNIEIFIYVIIFLLMFVMVSFGLSVKNGEEMKTYLCENFNMSYQKLTNYCYIFNGTHIKKYEIAYVPDGYGLKFGE